MKRKFAAALLASVMAIAPAAAQSNKKDMEITAGASAYRFDNFRGLSAPKGAVVMPWTSASYKGLNILGYTTHYTAKNDVAAGKIGSAFLAADFRKNISAFSASAGYEIFTFPAFGIGRSQAARASLQYNKFVNPRIEALYDFESGSGLHAEFSLSRVVKNLRVKAALGCNSRYFREQSGLAYAEANASYPVKFKNVSIEPMVSYTHGFTKDFERRMNFGVSISKKLR